MLALYSGVESHRLHAQEAIWKGLAALRKVKAACFLSVSKLRLTAPAEPLVLSSGGKQCLGC